MWLGFSLLYLRQNIKPYTSNRLELSWKILQKNNLHDFRSVEFNSRYIYIYIYIYRCGKTVESGRVWSTRIFHFFFNYKNKSMTTCLERMNKIS